MSLMVSVSGIRGIVGESLTPLVLATYAQAFATWLFERRASNAVQLRGNVPTVVIGRDTRPTGNVIADYVQATLVQAGCNVVNLGVATTPTVEVAVIAEQADGGIIISASHNPLEWNALKLLNQLGEFLTAEQSQQMLKIAETKSFRSAKWNEFGMAVTRDDYDDFHIRKILSLPELDLEKIRRRGYKILVDAVNGAGSLIVPKLCRALGAREVIEISCKPTGIFPRNPEPIEENLVETQGLTAHYGADVGVVVDPDVDRVCFVCEDGSLFGEEYTLVACADFWLTKKKGDVVSNLSSSRALRDIAEKHRVRHHAAKVGEANVIETMKAVRASIGGEGNGGVILPDAHYGRDALVGVALFLAAFAEWQEKNPTGKLSDFKKTFPQYFIAKRKLALDASATLDEALSSVAKRYANERVTTIDGVKIDFAESWVHLRKSNTEPIVRIYAEAKSKAEAESLAKRFAEELAQCV
ncbi:MAG: phosphoglucosamine mutase [Chloroherpetonaceae bacterium]|nr:phosphoglucosamine mutase [Chloroherpetonaceae bacterium]